MDKDTLSDIEQSCKNVTMLEDKSGIEIADLLVEHVWCHLPLFSAASDLIMAAIDRLVENDKTTPANTI